MSSETVPLSSGEEREEAGKGEFFREVRGWARVEDRTGELQAGDVKELQDWRSSW